MNPDDIDTMVRTIDGEAENQGPEGWVAVAHVIVNRAIWRPAAWWGATPKGVCLHSWQFSCWLAGPDCTRIKDLSAADPRYEEIAQIIQQVLGNQLPDPTRGSTTYKVAGTSASWDRAVASQTPIQVGAHLFWRLAPNGVCLPFLGADNA